MPHEGEHEKFEKIAIFGGPLVKWIRTGEEVPEGYHSVDPPEILEYKFHYQSLNYGAFGAHNQKTGHITKYRLMLQFLDGKLIDWKKSALQLEILNGEGEVFLSHPVALKDLQSEEAK